MRLGGGARLENLVAARRAAARPATSESVPRRQRPVLGVTCGSSIKPGIHAGRMARGRAARPAEAHQPDHSAIRTASRRTARRPAPGRARRPRRAVGRHQDDRHVRPPRANLFDQGKSAMSGSRRSSTITSGRWSNAASAVRASEPCPPGARRSRAHSALPTGTSGSALRHRRRAPPEWAFFRWLMGTVLPRDGGQGDQKQWRCPTRRRANPVYSNGGPTQRILLLRKTHQRPGWVVAWGLAGGHLRRDLALSRGSPSASCTSGSWLLGLWMPNPRAPLHLASVATVLSCGIRPRRS